MARALLSPLSLWPRSLRHFSSMSMLPRALTVLTLLVLAVPASAQQAATGAPTTREEAIASERADKLAELWPERQSPMVDTVNRLVERGFREGLDSGQGGNGPQIVL